MMINFSHVTDPQSPLVPDESLSTAQICEDLRLSGLRIESRWWSGQMSKSDQPSNDNEFSAYLNNFTTAFERLAEIKPEHPSIPAMASQIVRHEGYFSPRRYPIQSMINILRVIAVDTMPDSPEKYEFCGRFIPLFLRQLHYRMINLTKGDIDHSDTIARLRSIQTRAIMYEEYMITVPPIVKLSHYDW